MTNIKGVLSTPMTPFDKFGELDLSRIASFASWQKGCGISGFYILGTWGGFATLSNSERIKVMEAYCRVCDDLKLSVIVNIGANSFDDTIEFGRLAKQFGATAVSSVVPPYYSTAGYLEADDYMKYFGKLAESCDLPLYLYNNPRTSNVLLSPKEFVDLVKCGVAGVKDGSKSVAWLVHAQRMLCESALEADIIPGNTVGLLYGRIYGCQSATSGAAVVFPNEAVDIFKYIDLGDMASAVKSHRRILALRQVMGRLSAPPSMAHYLLNGEDHSLGFPSPLWPRVDNEQFGLAAKQSIQRILQEPLVK